MTAKRSIRDLERQCKKEPDNLVLRLLLAAALREAGRTAEAVPLYRSVANSYQQQGRKTQAVAVLKSLLEIDPSDPDTRALLDRIDHEASGPAAAIPTSTATPPAGSPIFPVTYPAPPPPPSAPQQIDQERPSTIPSLDGQRLRKSGQQPAARVLADDVVLRDLAPVRPSGQSSGTRSLPPQGGSSPGSTPGGSSPGGSSPGSTPGGSSPGGSSPGGSSPGTPARPKLATLAGLGLAGPGIRGPTATRGSSATFTPTPLPTPIPFHEADRSGPIETPPHDDDAATRIADSFRTGRTPFGPPPPLRPITGDTTGRGVAIGGHRARTSAPELTATGTDIDLANDLDTRRVRRLSEHELDLLSEPPPGQTDLIARLDPSDLDAETDPDASPLRRSGMLDDEPTRIADDRPATPSRPSNDFDVPTGVHRAVTPPPTGAATPARRAGPPGRSPTRTTKVSEAPTPPRPRAETPPPPRATSPLPRATSRRPPPPAAVAPPPDLDEPTRVTGSSRDSDSLTPPPRGHLTPMPAYDTSPVRRPDTATATDTARVSEPGMHRSHAFDRSFSETLEEMDPDGSAIEAPLDMFSMLPPEALDELSRGMLLRRFAPGEIVIREGDPGDACYVIVDGEVRVLKNDPLTPDAGPVEVARLGPRSLFGEFALLADRRRHATVQSTSHCDLYEIPRQLLRQLAANYPDVGPALESFYRQRLLATLLRTAPFFAPLPEDNRARLLARFQPIRAEPGEAIVVEGYPAGGLYLIVLGAVEITRRVGRNRSVILASLHEGAYFGEMSLLSGDPTTATVIASGPVELALLAPRDFYEIVAEHPELWASIRREARTRALENAKLVAGETGTV